MKKMKRFIFGAFGLLALASCSNDELTSVNRDGDEIAFSVVTNSATRAADVYCNQNKPNSFKVWATYDNAAYINGDQITYNENSSKWENTSGTRYWPNEGEVTFYAHVNDDDVLFQWNDGSPKIEDFTVETNVTEQKDLLYAVKKASKADDQVTLNFRHALSQIVFQAKNTNPNLYVEISGVSVCKVKRKGAFTYPLDNTNDNIEDHNGNGTIKDYNDGSWGKWVDVSEAETYPVTFEAVKLIGSNSATAKSLTSQNDENKEYNSNALLLLPQKSDAWVVSGESAKATPSEQDGTYFLVKCQMWNVAGDSYDSEKDVCLWPKGENPEPKDVAIPVKIDWEQGKKYIYTFVFGDGNGGYNPEPDPDPDKPQPALVPITFEVTVDDFVNVDEGEIKMEKPKATEGEETEA